jgi:hypothetical protein
VNASKAVGLGLSDQSEQPDSAAMHTNADAVNQARAAKGRWLTGA